MQCVYKLASYVGILFITFQSLQIGLDHKGILGHIPDSRSKKLFIDNSTNLKKWQIDLLDT